MNAIRRIRIGASVAAMIGAWISSSCVAIANAQTTDTTIPLVAVIPQNDKFTFEIERVINKELYNKAKGGFQLLDQGRIENIVMYPCLCDGFKTNYPGVQHQDSANKSDQVLAAVIMRSAIYIALRADSADGAWHVNLIMGETRRSHDERLLARARFTKTEEIGEQFAKAVMSDTLFVRLTAPRR